jgi:uncharacterized membrane protein
MADGNGHGGKGAERGDYSFELLAGMAGQLWLALRSWMATPRARIARTAARMAAHTQVSRVPVLTPHTRGVKIRLHCLILWNQLRTLLQALPTYPALPPPPQGKGMRWARAVLVLMVGGFIIYFTAYLFATHDAYKTYAEDMGIMTQALWNTTHGAPLHQTICDILSENDCLGDVSRLAVHVEPIMVPLALLYALIPSPKTLQFVQVLVVAAGAFPAFAIATRRLQQPWAGVAFALLYLAYPALDSALAYDFHAVTLSAAFLMFALYYLLDGNTRGLVVASILAMSTKEEVGLTIIMIGLWVMLLQRRWRLGAGLVIVALAWTVVAVGLMHAFSPLGHSPMASRYSPFGTTPPEIAKGVLSHPALVVRTYLLDDARRGYVAALMGPMAFLPVLSPWILALSGPALLINMLSDKVSMYSGAFQYNAEIVPVLILSSIETLAVLLVLLRKAGAQLAQRAIERAGGIWREQGVVARFRQHAQAITRAITRAITQTVARAIAVGLRLRMVRVARLSSPLGSPLGVPLARRAGMSCVLLLLLLAPLATCLRAQRQDSYLPIGRGFNWPHTTVHTHVADQLIATIPPTATVSAQNELVPHLSNRRFMYLFPFAAHDAQFVLLDTTAYEYAADLTHDVFCSGLQSMLDDPNYTVMQAEDGYVLFERVPNYQPGGRPDGQSVALPFSVPACDVPQG